MMKKRLAVLLTIAMTAACSVTVKAEEITPVQGMEEEFVTLGTGHSFETATGIDTNTEITDSITGQAGNSAYYTNDNYYKFTIGKRGYVTIDFSLDKDVDVSSLNAGWDLNLYQMGQAGAIKTYSNLKSAQSSAKLSLKPGEYCIKISPHWQNDSSCLGKTYNFNVNEIADAAWEAEDNDSVKKANPIKLGTAYKGTIGNEDDADWYVFHIAENSKVDISLKPEAESSAEDIGFGWDVALYEAGNGDAIKEMHYVTTESRLSRIVPEGKYYVKVSGPQHDSIDAVYEFKVNAGATCAVEKPKGHKFATNQGYHFYEENGGTVRCYDSENVMVKNTFLCDGKYTYFFQADGSAMRDCLTYHPDGIHVIYFDENGHETFNNFIHVKKSISGDAVDDLCFFNVYGYMYVDCMTFDKSGTNLYYVNPYGVIERNGWFAFSEKQGGGIGYANTDGTLLTNQFGYDRQGRKVYFEGDGKITNPELD